MRLGSLTNQRFQQSSLASYATPRFTSKLDPDELDLKCLFKPREPFFTTLHYPHLKLGLLNFERADAVDVKALKTLIADIQADPALSERHHQSFAKILDTAVNQLEKTGMFQAQSAKPLSYRQQLSAQAGKTIAKLVDTASPGKAGYAELAELWILALSCNARNEMAAYTAVWGALSLPFGKPRDLVTSLGAQHASRDVRRLASHGASTIQEPGLKAAVLSRMSHDSDALIRLRSDVLKNPRSPINWLLGLVILRKPSY